MVKYLRYNQGLTRDGWRCWWFALWRPTSICCKIIAYFDRIPVHNESEQQKL